MPLCTTRTHLPKFYFQLTIVIHFFLPQSNGGGALTFHDVHSSAFSFLISAKCLRRFSGRAKFSLFWQTIFLQATAKTDGALNPIQLA